MTLDIAMGGSTNTILHSWRSRKRPVIDFTMDDRLSRVVPQLCKVAPNTDKYHIEDVHRAGGIFGILGELERAGLHTDVPTVHACPRWARRLRNGTSANLQDEAVHDFYLAGPRGIPTRWPSARRAAGPAWIWTAPKAASAPTTTPSQGSGLAVLTGNIAQTAVW